MNPGTFAGMGAGTRPGVPVRITQLKSGSGTFYPISTVNSWARVTIVGAGGGGQSGYYDGDVYGYRGGGGAAGGVMSVWIKLSAPSYSYAVGAAGNGGAAGSATPPSGGLGGNGGGNTRFGGMEVGGGQGSSGNIASGGVVGQCNIADYYASQLSHQTTQTPSAGITAFIGGSGAATSLSGSTIGGAAGFNGVNGDYRYFRAPALNAGGNTGSGGSSAYGRAGQGASVNQNPDPQVNAFGAGGGGGDWTQRGGVGATGVILIEEYLQ